MEFKFINVISLKYYFIKILVICSIFSLIGCFEKSEEEHQAEIQSDSSEILALDFIHAGYDGGKNEINIIDYVRTSDNTSPRVVNVVNVSSDNRCDNIIINDEGFVVNPEMNESLPQYCVYEYYVENISSAIDDSAINVVTLSNPESPFVTNTPLPTLSEVAELEEVIVIDVPIENDLTLSEEVTLLDEGALVAIDTITNQIIYQAGGDESALGINRLMYSATTAEGVVRVGSIDVAVSSFSFNSAPHADNFYYVSEGDQQTGALYTIISENEVVVVDVSDYVSDSDFDSLQLVDVSAFNAEVGLRDRVNVENLTFTFSARRPGRYQVSYTISDHKGGYATGIVELYVDGAWSNVIVVDTKDVFSAPLSLTAASIGGYKVSGIAAENNPPNGNGVTNVPTYTWSIADSICRAQGGSLPTHEQWTSFVAQEGNPYLFGDTSIDTVGEWPVKRRYWSSTEKDENQFLTVDLESGELTSDNHGENGTEPYLGYLACIDKTATKLNIVHPGQIIVDNPEQLYAEYQTASGLIFPYEQPLEWRVSKPHDPELEAVPEFNNNVSVGTYTGVLETHDEGYLEVEVSDITGVLSDSLTLLSIRNFIGFDPQVPDFEVEDDATSCNQSILFQGATQTGYAISNSTLEDTFRDIPIYGFEYSAFVDGSYSTPNYNFENYLRLFSSSGCAESPQGESYITLKQSSTTDSSNYYSYQSIRFYIGTDLSEYKKVRFSFYIRENGMTNVGSGTVSGIYISLYEKNDINGLNHQITISDVNLRIFDLHEARDDGLERNEIKISKEDIFGWQLVEVELSPEVGDEVIDIMYKRWEGYNHQTTLDFDDLRLVPIIETD